MEGKTTDRIFTIEVIGCTEINLSHPKNSVVVRVSIVDQKTGKLLKKMEELSDDGSKVTRYCFSSNEKTEYIPPVCTKPISMDDIPKLRPKWEDSFLYNCLTEHILDDNVIIYFEIINLEVDPKYKHFQPIAWAFLRPKSSNGIENIDRSCKLQLHSYPKGFNPTIQEAKIPVAALFATRKKIPSVLIVEIKNTNWVTPYDFTSRPTAFFQREVVNVEISELLQNDKNEEEDKMAEEEEEEEKGEEKENEKVNEEEEKEDEEEEEEAEKIRPANKNCMIPRVLVAQVPLGDYGAYTLNFNKNGDLLVAAVRTGSTYSIHFFSVYDFSNRFGLIQNAHQDLIYELSFSEDDELLISASGDRDVKVWVGDGSENKPKFTLSHTCHVYTAKFHPSDPRLIATGGSDGIVRFWDGPTQKVLRECVGNEGTINSLVFSPDGQTLYAGDSSGIITVINTNISHNGIDDIVRKQITQEPELAKCGITHLSMERSNNLLLVQSKDSMLRVFETKVMVPSQRYSGIVCTDTLLKSALSPDCEYILSGSQDGTAKCWTVRKAEEIPTPEWSFKFDGPVTAVAWNRVENMVAFSSFAPKMPIIVFQDPTPVSTQE
jgi:hypothetical protein